MSATIALVPGSSEHCNEEHGLSVFLVDLREAGDRIRVSPLDTMINHETNEVFF